MAIAALQKIEHVFGKVEVLKGVDLEISQGERVALIGANGTGKTTMLHILRRELLPTAGQVFWAKGLRIVYLSQQPEFDPDETVRQAARKPFAAHIRLEGQMRDLSARMAQASGEELERLMKQYADLESRHVAGGGFAWQHRIEQVLAGVGFRSEHLDLPAGVLSGGQKCRLSLACVLLSQADLLLLDEPTNHLDLEAVQWLEKYLVRLEAAVLMISHDRYLLDKVATKIYELRDGVTEAYPGNYSNYVQQRGIRQLHRERQFQKDQAYIAKERDFIARFHASGSRSREARGRATRLERRLKNREFVTDAPSNEQTLKLKISAASRGSDFAVRTRGLSKAFGELRIVDELDLDLRNGQKMAIMGPNGIGKTTLLRMITGEVEPDAGTIKVGQGMTVGYYDQQQVGLDEDLCVLDQMRQFAGGAEEGLLRNYLARFLFRGDEVYKSVRTLSGGERSRLLLARLFYQRPNFLVFDEPTNHLDIPSREMLEEALAEYDGTVLLVTHDRYLVDQVCDRLLLVWGAERWESFEGNFSRWQMLQDEKAQRQAAAAAEAEAERASRAKAGPASKAVPVNSGVRVAGLNSYQLSRLTLQDIEKQIHQAENRLAEIEHSYTDPAIYSDPEKFAQRHAEHEQTRQDLDRLMEIWEHKMETAEDGGA